MCLCVCECWYVLWVEVVPGIRLRPAGLLFSFYIRHFIAFSKHPHHPDPILPFGAPGKARKTLDISFAIFFSCLHFMTFSLALLGGGMGWLSHTYTDKRKFLVFFLPAFSPDLPRPRALPPKNWQHLRNAIFPFGWQAKISAFLLFVSFVVSCSCFIIPPFCSLSF